MLTPAAHLEHLRNLTATLRSNLEACSTDPQVDPVHDVRTGTRRVQALVEAMVRERGDVPAEGDPFRKAAITWLEILKKVRRAAAPVRDLDVHRKLLQKLVKVDANDAAPAPAVELLRLTPMQQQANDLDMWLHHARQHHSADLKKKAARLLPKFDAQAEAFASATAQQTRTRRRPRSAAVVALESFVRLSDEMQQLDAGNLHDFRKGAKKARYIAESAAEDAHALAVGKALKKLQDEIGDWHDWLVLGDEARAALGDEGADLIALLDAERDQHYAISMKTITRMRGRLLGEWIAATQTPRRRASGAPVASS